MRWTSKDWFFIKSTVSNNLNLPFRPVSILTFIDDVASITMDPIAIATGNLIIQLYLWSYSISMTNDARVTHRPDQLWPFRVPVRTPVLKKSAKSLNWPFPGRWSNKMFEWKFPKILKIFLCVIFKWRSGRFQMTDFIYLMHTFSLTNVV